MKNTTTNQIERLISTADALEAQVVELRRIADNLKPKPPLEKPSSAAVLRLLDNRIGKSVGQLVLGLGTSRKLLEPILESLIADGKILHDPKMGWYRLRQDA